MTAEFARNEEPGIVGETEDYIAVFKPAGMHSVPAGMDGGEGDLLSWFARMMPGARQVFESDEPGTRASELGMVSRLDRGTSGIILFARTPALHRALLAHAPGGCIRKEYRLLSTPSARLLPGCLPGLKPLELKAGVLRPPSARGDDSGWLTIESFFRSYGSSGARVACVDPCRSGDCLKKLTKKTYTTLFRLEAGDTDALSGALRMTARIGLGFRHQIRAHLAWSGFPIVGDGDYGGLAAPRLFLEAHRVEVDPVGGAGPAVFELYGDGHILGS